MSGPQLPVEYGIKVEGWNADLPCPVIGAWLEWYDPRADAWGGEEVFGFTRDPLKAMRFPAPAMAISKYREPLVDERNVPRQRADRPGALPGVTGVERPLMAFTISVEALPTKTLAVVVDMPIGKEK